MIRLPSDDGVIRLVCGGTERRGKKFLASYVTTVLVFWTGRVFDRYFERTE